MLFLLIPVDGIKKVMHDRYVDGWYNNERDVWGEVGGIDKEVP